MRAKQSILGLVYTGGEVRRPPLVGMQFLHERAVRSAHIVGTRPRLKAQDLVGLLFRHRARLRASARPRVSVTVSVFTPTGKPAVEIRL